MNPPEHALVLSCDEQSQIQALNRTQPGLLMKRGRALLVDGSAKAWISVPSTLNSTCSSMARSNFSGVMLGRPPNTSAAYMAESTFDLTESGLLDLAAEVFAFTPVCDAAPQFEAGARFRRP